MVLKDAPWQAPLATAAGRDKLANTTTGKETGIGLAGTEAKRGHTWPESKDCIT